MIYSFAPTQAAIESAVNRGIGNPGAFQRVAEQVASGLYPRLASSLVPYGRNPNDKTIQGWPDAYLTKEDGTLIAIEATTASDARKKHWKQDLAKLKTRLPIERLGGLVWVAWCDPSAPTDEGDMRRQVCQLGFADEDVHIVFRKRLCSLLTAPFHARFWLNDLQLPVTSDPFSRISDVIRRGAQSPATRIFPTPEEFENDRVHAPRLLVQLEQALEDRGAAIVVGHGASGKTTLAYLLAHRHRFLHAPTYMLDLTARASDPTLVERASEALTACADRGVLFVIDNAHLDPSAADSLIEHWKAFGQGSELVVLMRRVRDKAEVWDRDPKVENSGLPSFDLVIEAADLEGVYRRHHQALEGLMPPQVDTGTLTKWMNLFGGDLIAFSAGILGLLERGGEPADLGPEDARGWVRHHYLAGPENEQSALLDLAAVAEIEGLVPIEAFAEEVLKPLIQRGLVWLEVRGSRRRFYSYRLAHPGLGTLLRGAAGCAESSRKDRCRVLRDHTFACTLAAQGQARSGDIAEAYALLEGLWQRSNWPLSDINIAYWGLPLRLTEEIEVISRGEIVERSREWLTEGNARETVLKSALASTVSHLARICAITSQRTPEIYTLLLEELSSIENMSLLRENILTSYLGGIYSFIEFAKVEAPEVERIVVGILRDEENRHKIVRQALATPLDNLNLFLGYADEKMPEVAKAIRAGLAENPDVLVKQALATPLAQLASFLGYADRKMPEVAKAIRAGLAENPDVLVRQALATPLDQLASFLEYANAKLPKVAKAIETGLAKNPDVLVKQALAAPLGSLVSFLEYADGKMPEVAKAIEAGLAKNPEVLVKQALAAPLDHLASFLGYARRKMANIERVLQNLLLTGDNVSRIVGRAVQDGPEKITALGKHDPAYAKIFSMIDVETWSRQWREAYLGQPHWFIGFASLCYKQDRAVLVGPIATAIISTARAEDCPSPQITVRHLTYIVTAPHECTPTQVEQFFSRCFASGWLGEQYSSPDASVGALAGAVRSIAMSEEEHVRRHFLHPALVQRLLAEQPKKEHASRHVAEWLQLLSAIRLLGHGATIHLQSMDPRMISEALEVWPPGPIDQGIQAIQAGLWAGSREWCHITQQRPVVAGDLARAVLGQFRAAIADDRPRIAALNLVMIDWLGRCQDQGWKLAADTSSLLDAVENQFRLQFASEAEAETRSELFPRVAAAEET